MATVTSTIHAAMNAFGDGMLARANIISAKVQVSTGYLGGDSAAKESIQLTDVTPATQEWGLIGNRRRNEEYTLNGLIWVLKAGKNETVIRLARARAFELLAEVEDFLRLDPTIASTTLVSELASYPLDQGANQEGRWAQVDFAIACKKDLRSS
jgi:hypothetical protein